MLSLGLLLNDINFVIWKVVEQLLLILKAKPTVFITLMSKPPTLIENTSFV